METLTRICVTGPECTGKTTLAARLAEHFGTAWSAEYAREYAVARGNELTVADVEPIARGQIANEDRADTRHPTPDTRIVIHDTDLISTVVYARHYYGECPAWIVDEARRRRADLYLLMDTDLEWVADPARDSPGELREELFDAFRRTLEEFDARFVIVSGVGEERWAGALAAIRMMVSSRA